MRFVRRCFFFLPSKTVVVSVEKVDFSEVNSVADIPAKQNEKTIAVNKYFIMLVYSLINDKIKVLLHNSKKYFSKSTI